MNIQMKQSLLTVVCLLSCMVCTAETVFSDSRYENRLGNGVSVIVDERIELVSIAFRLAGARPGAGIHGRNRQPLRSVHGP